MFLFCFVWYIPKNAQSYHFDFVEYVKKKKAERQETSLNSVYAYYFQDVIVLQYTVKIILASSKRHCLFSIKKQLKF